jgi:(acyl-carrier-protein) S-malonyltransferase
MAKDFFEMSSAVRDLFTLASDVSGIDLKHLLFEGSEDDLKQTCNTQIAMALAEASAATCAREYGHHPAMCAGFSVGEWPALAEAGVVSYGDMFRLVAARGRLMDEAGKRSGGSTMSAVIGLSPEAIESAIERAGLKQVWIANYNSPAQSVISGTEVDVAAAEIAIKEAGAKRAIRLKVSGAFHSPIMAYAAERFAEEVSSVPFADPKITLFSNVTGRPVANGTEAKELAVKQITSPVRWIAEENAILAERPDFVAETGPGTVLGGLWKAAAGEIPCHPFGTLDQISSHSL